MPSFSVPEVDCLYPHSSLRKIINGTNHLYFYYVGGDEKSQPRISSDFEHLYAAAALAALAGSRTPTQTRIRQDTDVPLVRGGACGSLHQPVYLGLRDDIDAGECTEEAQQLKYKAAA